MGDGGIQRCPGFWCARSALDPAAMALGERSRNQHWQRLWLLQVILLVDEWQKLTEVKKSISGFRMWAYETFGMRLLGRRCREL